LASKKLLGGETKRRDVLNAFRGFHGSVDGDFVAVFDGITGPASRKKDACNR
jgi:hypothetical protein